MPVARWCNAAYIERMTKQEAIRLFGTGTKLARAIGVTPQAIYQWPDELTPVLNDRVMAAMMRQVQAQDNKLTPRG